MPRAFLDDRGMVRVAGADARAFLQGLFTCDMDKVTPACAGFGALLTPQGKIIVDFLVIEREGAFWLDCPRALAADLAKRLGFYRLRAKVEIADESAGFGVLASWGEEATGTPDPRRLGLGGREIVPRAGLVPDASARAAYEALCIGAGVPTGGVDFDYGDTFPHEANMDLLNGVDFRKGCYIGQEVVSRVEHRGTARKRIARLLCEGPALARGHVVTADAQEIGVVGSSMPGAALVSARVDRAREAMAAGAGFTCAGRVVTLALPDARG